MPPFEEKKTVPTNTVSVVYGAITEYLPPSVLPDGNHAPAYIWVEFEHGGHHRFKMPYCVQDNGSFNIDNFNDFLVEAYPRGGIVTKDTPYRVRRMVDETYNDYTYEHTTPKGGARDIDRLMPQEKPISEEATLKRLHGLEPVSYDIRDIDTQNAAAKAEKDHLGPEDRSLLAGIGRGLAVSESKKQARLAYGSALTLSGGGFDISAPGVNFSCTEQQVNYGGSIANPLEKFVPSTVSFPYPPKLPMPPLAFFGGVKIAAQIASLA